MPWPVSIQAIRAAEAKLGVRFPDDLVAGMTAMNGGAVRALNDVWPLLPFLDTSDRKRTARTSNDVVRETLSFREMEWFPQEAVVLAALDGNCLLLLPQANDPSRLKDEVFVWHMDAGGVECVFESTAELMQKRL